MNFHAQLKISNVTIFSIKFEVALSFFKTMFRILLVLFNFDLTDFVRFPLYLTNEVTRLYVTRDMQYCLFDFFLQRLQMFGIG